MEAYIYDILRCSPSSSAEEVDNAFIELTHSKHHLYTLLNIKPTASLQDIKESFKKLALAFHPDKSTSPHATIVFQHINHAYTVLSNNVSRSDYNRQQGIKTPSSWENPEYRTQIRENLKSLTIYVAGDVKCWLTSCRSFYSQDGIDRGSHGVQFKGKYHSPTSDKSFGSISVTLYRKPHAPHTIHVQGTSYMLWEVEHFPELQKIASTQTNLPTDTPRLLRQRKSAMPNPCDVQHKCQICNVADEGLIRCCLCEL